MKHFTIGFFAMTLACGLTAQAQETAPGNAIVLTIEFPHEVTIGKMPATGGSPVVGETIRLTLTNNSSASVTLHKANDCETRIWTVTDSSGQLIDDRAVCPMIFMPVTQTIAPHARFTATENVALDGTKYRDGAQYTLHYTFWGIAAAAAFTAHVAH
ncbi:MAG: hypothetical protein ACLQUZ_01260 [Rhizomicrobium sp.]